MPTDQAIPFAKKDFSALVKTLLGDIQTLQGGREPLTDTHEGSVVRTLVEVFAHEMAVSYQQLERVYQNAYLDTARGSALDKVVDLLAIKRYKAGRLEGSVTFSRATPATEAIHIPAGTLVAGRGVAHCATLQASILEKGQTSVRVTIVSQESSHETIVAKALNTMPSPITGIETVINEGDLNSRQRVESDRELRQRAHRLIQASRSGTTAALEEAVRTLGLEHIKILEYTGYDAPDTVEASHEDDALTPGMIKVVVEADKHIMAEVEARILKVKPAGVMVRCLQAALIKVCIATTLILNGAYTRQQKQQIETELNQQLKNYFARLAIGESVYCEKIKALLLNHSHVTDCQALEKSTQEQAEEQSLLHIVSSPNAKTLVNNNLMLRSHERAVFVESATRLILQDPYSPVLLTIHITLKNTDSVNEKLKSEMKQVCILQIKQLKSTMSTDEFWKVLKAKSSKLSRLHITVIHLSNGHSMELIQQDDMPEDSLENRPKDALSSREKPELSQFIVDVNKTET